MIREREGRLLLTAREAAATLAVSERKLWDLTHNGGVPHTQIGRFVRYRVTDLVRWIDHHTSTPGSGADEAPAASGSSDLQEPPATNDRGDA